MLRVSICIVILLKFSCTYASESTEIRKIFNNVSKYIKADKKYKGLDILEKKSNKFNIKVTRNSNNNLDINSALKKAKDSFESGNSAKAIFFLNKIIAKFPYHKNSLITLGNIYYVNEDYKKAKETYIKLLHEYPGDSLIVENFLTVFSKYSPDLALGEMLKLDETLKLYPPLLANLSLIYIEKKDFIKAKEYMTAAVSIDQNNIFYIYNLAIILDKLSDLENAAVFYERLLNKATISKNVSKIIPIQQVEVRLQLIKLLTHI